MAKGKDKKKATKAPAKKAAKPAKKASSKPTAKGKSSSAKPAPKKNAKPAVKAKAKPAPKSKPASKAKPAVKKPVVATKSVKSKSAPKKVEKPVVKSAVKAVTKPVKKEEVKKDSKKEKESKPLVAAGKSLKPDVKKALKPGKKDKSSKKAKGDSEIEGEDIDMDGGLLEQGMEVEADVVDDDDDLLEVDEPRGKGRPSKKKPAQDKKSFDSEEYVRKQVVKIDLTKNLVKKSNQAQPKPFVNTSDNRTRYSDAELAEFKELILKKLEEAQADFDLLKQTLSHADDHGTDDTSPTFKLLEDGSDVLSKEETAQLAARQEKYIVSLKNALIRIENKSYGICRASGKLIPKERLRSVPHATLGIDAKLNQNN